MIAAEVMEQLPVPTVTKPLFKPYILHLGDLLFQNLGILLSIISVKIGHIQFSTAYLYLVWYVWTLRHGFLLVE